MSKDALDGCLSLVQTPRDQPDAADNSTSVTCDDVTSPHHRRLSRDYHFGGLSVPVLDTVTGDGQKAQAQIIRVGPYATAVVVG